MSLTIDVSNGIAVLALPKNASLEEGKSFLLLQSNWIQEQLARLPPRRLFTDGTTFAVLGERRKIRHLPLLPKSISQEGRELVVGGYSEPNEQIIAWLKCTADTIFKHVSACKAEILDITPPKISVRDPKSSWGSCSQLGRLSLSWRLILAPPYVLDYVVSHEVAHLLEFNHGNKFWQLVGELCPRQKKAKAWLGKNGPLLLRYG